MIDLHHLRRNFADVSRAILKKEPAAQIAQLHELDTELRRLTSDVEDLRKQKNELAAQGSRGFTEELRARSKEVGANLKAAEASLNEVATAFRTLALNIPNPAMPEIPEGGKEANRVVETKGKKPIFSFTPQNHLELNKNLGWFEFEATARMSSSQLVSFKGDGVKLVYALTRMMLRHNVAHGYEPVIPPVLINRQALQNSSHLPKFDGDFYAMPEDGLALIPTAEAPLTNLYADTILESAKLPIRQTAWTSCFRREAGGYGSQERGMIRVHQFDKVELYSIVQPDQAPGELDHMVSCATSFLDLLGLHYQVSLLAAQDCSFASAKTFDIEVWLPGQDSYYEVSSCSNCTDFQARRSGIRYRPGVDEKPQLCHTLNASSLALPRLIVALVESYQQEDGSVVLPEVLVNEMNALW
jgi:seryl-tRNA synthetase